jgi:hypothetical protein
MDPNILVIVVQGIEKLVTLAGGLLSIWIGYRLFAQIPASQNSGGQFNLPGGASFVLSKVGPGIFFALFGSVVLGYSVTRPVSFNLSDENRRISTTYSGMAETAAGTETQQTCLVVPPNSPPRAEIIRLLNKWLASLPSEADGAMKSDRSLAVREAKLAMLREFFTSGSWTPSRPAHFPQFLKGPPRYSTTG